jgi:hypothetical protein
MFDLDKQSIDIECPRCHFYNPIFLRQVRVWDVIICRGCKGNVQLQDHMNQYRNARFRIIRAMEALESQIKKIGKIKIKF